MPPTPTTTGVHRSPETTAACLLPAPVDELLASLDPDALHHAQVLPTQQDGRPVTEVRLPGVRLPLPVVATALGRTAQEAHGLCRSGTVQVDGPVVRLTLGPHRALLDEHGTTFQVEGGVAP